MVIKHPEKYMHAAARKRAGLPFYITSVSKRTRTRNERFRKQKHEEQRDAFLDSVRGAVPSAA